MSKENKTIAEKTNQLQKLLEWFDGDDFELEQATVKFKEAKSLADEITKDLEELKNEIEVVKRDFTQE